MDEITNAIPQLVSLTTNLTQLPQSGINKENVEGFFRKSYWRVWVVIINSCYDHNGKRYDNELCSRYPCLYGK